MSKIPTSPMPKMSTSSRPKTRRSSRPEMPPPSTIAETLAQAQELTQTNFFPNLRSSDRQPTMEDLEKELREYKATADRLAVPFSLYQHNLADASPKAVGWLWENRLPLAGITLLDGDHGCGKSLLALHIAACVSSGSCLPDGTPTLQGGVVIISPHVDATTTQLQLLTALGADLSRVEILSFIQDFVPDPHTGGYCPFSLPEDLPRLFNAIERVNARLVILDPLISLLSRNNRWTNERLGHLLTDLNQRLIERNIACLLIRNCTAKGGHARPTLLERSDHFVTIATSRLLLSPDPFQPDHLLLSHDKNTHTALTPTLSLQIRPWPTNPHLPHIALLGSHTLTADDLMAHRPDTLHRRLLSQHLLAIITAVPDSVPVATLYARSPHSSPFQIQRSLSDLLNMGQIERPARGFYTSAAANPIFPPNATVAKTTSPELAKELTSIAATTLMPEPAKELTSIAATTLMPEPAKELTSIAATTLMPEPAKELTSIAATTLIPEPAKELTSIAATTLMPEPAKELTSIAATTPVPESSPEPAKALNGTAAATPNIPPASTLKPCGNWRHALGCQCNNY